MLELFLSDLTTVTLLILYLELSPLILNVQWCHISSRLLYKQIEYRLPEDN